jgi:hypothetical protein
MPIWLAALLVWGVGLPALVFGALGAWMRYERWLRERRRPQGRVIEFRPAASSVVPPARRKRRGW